MRPAIAALMLVALTACGAASEDADSEAADYEGDSDEVLAGETYDEYDDRRDALEGERGSFAGYGCTVDCSGHEAGYDWAEENDITDPDNCGGNSWSFVEGCRAYAEENADY